MIKWEGQGISPDAVILQANGRVVRNVDEFRDAIAQGQPDKRLLMLIRQQGV
jgi:S1-C subfamily serine protease